jgi:hypothetical protein
VRDAGASPLGLPPYARLRLAAAGGLRHPRAPSPPLRGGEHPLKALRQLRFSRLRLEKQAVSGLRSASFADLTPGFGAARFTPFRGCSPPTSSASRVGAFGPPRSDRRAWARLFPRVGALSKPAKSAPGFGRCPRAEIPTCGSPQRRGSRCARRTRAGNSACTSLRSLACVPRFAAPLIRSRSAHSSVHSSVVGERVVRYTGSAAGILNHSGQRARNSGAAASIVTSRRRAAGCDAYAVRVRIRGGLRRQRGTSPGLRPAPPVPWSRLRASKGGCPSINGSLPACGSPPFIPLAASLRSPLTPPLPSADRFPF